MRKQIVAKKGANEDQNWASLGASATFQKCPKNKAMPIRTARLVNETGTARCGMRPDSLAIV